MPLGRREASGCIGWAASVCVMRKNRISSSPVRPRRTVTIIPRTAGREALDDGTNLPRRLSEPWGGTVTHRPDAQRSVFRRSPAKGMNYADFMMAPSGIRPVVT